ncbi:MAG: PAS domain S-box protein, partial [bacterium]|nr:PAS domain S-box protein [bacterium]
MKTLFISLSPNPPDGFEYRIPSKSDLTAGRVALLVDSLDDAFRLLDDFSQRVCGLVIITGDTFSHSSLGPNLRQLVVPDRMLVSLRETVSFFLDIMARGQQAEDENRTLKAELAHSIETNKKKLESCNPTDENSCKQIKELRKEIESCKRAEERLQGELVFNDMIIQSVPGLFYIFEKDATHLIRRNSTWATVTGYSEDELDKLSVLNAIGDRELGAEKIREVFEKGYASMENTLITKSGRHLSYYFSGRRLDINGNTYLIGLGEDIGERKSARLKLQESEAHLRDSRRVLQMVMNTIPQFLFWKDLDSVYLGCNMNFSRVAGFDNPEDIEGKTDYDMPWKKGEADFFRECDRKVMDNDSPEYHIIEPQLQANGKQAWVDTNKLPLHDEDGNVVGILGLYEDITKRKLQEEELRRYREQLEDLVKERTKENEKKKERAEI